jgi:hypothetical protein
VDLQSERLGAPRYRLADAAHADDAEAFAPDAVTEHPGRPSRPGAIAGEHLGAFGGRRGTAGISAMVMSAVSSVRTPGVLVTVMPRCSAVATSILSTPLPKSGDQLPAFAGMAQDAAVDLIGHGRHRARRRPWRPR